MDVNMLGKLGHLSGRKKYARLTIQIFRIFYEIQKKAKTPECEYRILVSWTILGLFNFNLQYLFKYTTQWIF